MHHTTILVKPVGAHTAADATGDIETRDIDLMGIRILDRGGITVIGEVYADMSQK